MNGFAVLVKLQAVRGRRQELLDLLRSALPVIERETTTLEYRMHEETSDDDILWIYESYTDPAARETHLHSENSERIAPAVAALLAGPPLDIMLSPVGGKSASPHEPTRTGVPR